MAVHHLQVTETRYDFVLKHTVWDALAAKGYRGVDLGAFLFMEIDLIMLLLLFLPSLSF